MTQFLLPYLFPTLRRRGSVRGEWHFCKNPAEACKPCHMYKLHTRRYDMFDVICTVYVSTVLLASIRLWLFVWAAFSCEHRKAFWYLHS
jgi:hypothetical protein